MKPQFSIVQPVTGDHAWDVTEGWSRALRELGILKNEFRPKGKWDSKCLDEDDGLLNYLKTEPNEYFLLLGFDWHSQPIHHGEIYELLRLRKRSNIAVIWEDYLAEEYLLDGIAEKMRAAWNRCKGAFSLAISNHESNVEALKRIPGSPRVAYVGFGIDMERFKSAPYHRNEKINRIYFSGKIDDWSRDKQGGPYALRRKILSHLEKSGVNIACTQAKQSDSSYCQNLINSAVCLNLPSFSLSPTLRNYEALAANSVLLTWKPKSPKYLTELEAFPNVFFYDPFRLDRISEICNRLLNIDSFTYQRLTSLGSQQLYRLSHESRIQNLIRLIKKQSVELSSHANSRRNLKLVIDMVFLQVACNGIAYVWDSIIKAYIQVFGPDDIVLIQRSENLLDDYGCRVIKADPVDWDDSPDKVSSEIDALLIKHGVSNYHFASSYYTYSSMRPSLQIIHDMIPELVGGTERVWTHKSDSIKNSEMLLCVSRSTRNDLVACHTESQHKIRLALNGMPTKHIVPVINTEEHAQIAARADSDFTILLIGGRYGYNGYKNSIVVFKAFKQFLARLPSGKTSKLLCISHNIEPEVQIREVINGLPVEFIEASDDQLAAIRRKSHCLVYPSAIEGFGLPIIEAAYDGMNVIASDILPHREAGLTAPDSVVYFSTFDSIALANAMEDCFQKGPPRNSDSHESVKQAIRHESLRRWQLTAQLMYSFLHNQEPQNSASSILNSSLWLRAVQKMYKFKQSTLPSNIQKAWEI